MADHRMDGFFAPTYEELDAPAVSGNCAGSQSCASDCPRPHALRMTDAETASSDHGCSD